MIFGTVGKLTVQRIKSGLEDRIGFDRWKQFCLLDSPQALVFWVNNRTTSPCSQNQFWFSKDRTKALFINGDLYNWDELRAETSGSGFAEGLWHLYEKWGEKFLDRMNGDFSLVLWDQNYSTMIIARDKIGVRPLFYSVENQGLIFGSDLDVIRQLLDPPVGFDWSAIFKYLVFCYNPGTDTFFQGAQRLRPGYWLKWSGGRIEIQPYWHANFNVPTILSEQDIAAEIRKRLDQAVKRRAMSDFSTGAFLSGGLDSSSIVSLLHRQGQKKISTYSFRCKGESFDESPYAKRVADTLNINHEIIEYKPEDVLLAEEMVKLMDEPFCDVGINIGTYILSRAACDSVVQLFTGDGGDELFAGHPVYLADKAARVFQNIPGFIRHGIFGFGCMLPDSDQKKDWKVKLKRFSESYSFPEAMGTHRWRAYYLPKDLKRLVHADLHTELNEEALFADMIRFNQEASGPDDLSRTLYSDYQTVVQFYLRRMDLARALGLHPRLPMLDPDVVEFCATIPSDLKIRGMSDTKYIERIAVEPLLPHDVVYRKDKLGHSVPLKNWLRDNTQVQEFVFDLISKETIQERHFFNYSFVERLKKEHLNRKRNHSHRLWALAILELWMRASSIKKDLPQILEDAV